MELEFPPLNGGVVPGLNDAGIETFEGDFARNVVRECAQNSLDAAVSHEAPVRLTITRISLDAANLPFVPKLQRVLRACGAYWSQHDKAREFFRSALQLAKQPNIDALKISDFGTTGVDGKDDDNTSRWFGLVKSRGVSNQKEVGSGGAYGIGKDAPLALSAFRTVLYSTRTLNGDVALQGVCRLVTHEGEDGVPTQGTGFIGTVDRNARSFRAIRDPNSIIEMFLREEAGLDVWILGSRQLDEDWSQPFIRSALANFWPAIHDRKISFLIGTDQIDDSNLGNWIERERHDAEVAEMRPYFLSVVSERAKTITANLPTVGESRLHVLLAKTELPKKVCLVRRSGMVIDYYQPRVGFFPFCGLYVCEGNEGNRLLKTLEPPRHDKWDAARADDSRAKVALKELKDWIRDELKKLVPHIGEDQFNEGEVPPDLLEEEPENPLPDDSANDPETDLGGVPKDIQPPTSPHIKPRVVKRKTSRGKSGAGDGGDDVENPKDGDAETTGGRKRKSGEKEGKSDLSPKQPNLQTRAFSQSQTNDVYELVLRSDGDYEGSVWVDAIGDDGSPEGIVLDGAEMIGRGKLEVEQARLKDVPLKAGEVCRIHVRLKNPGKYSLVASLS